MFVMIVLHYMVGLPAQRVGLRRYADPRPSRSLFFVQETTRNGEMSAIYTYVTGPRNRATITKVKPHILGVPHIENMG